MSSIAHVTMRRLYHLPVFPPTYFHCIRALKAVVLEFDGFSSVVFLDVISA